MKNLQSYFEQPFENIVVGKEKILEFFEDHKNSLIQQVNAGAPFQALVQPATDAVDALKNSLGDTSIHIAEQKSKTLTVDQCIELFVGKAKDFEAGVRDKFKKNSPVYMEFYPQGMEPFNKANKATVDALMVQLVSAFSNHRDDLGDARYEELKQIHDNYKNARDLQEQKKSETKGSRSSWDDNLKAMKMLAFDNLLTIAREYKGQPAKVKLYFNQSLLRLKHHAPAVDNDARLLTVPADSVASSDITFSAGDTFLIYNTGDVSLLCYTSILPDSPAPPTAAELKPGEEKGITAMSLGSPDNKYLVFANKDRTTDGEVKISLI